MRRKKMEFFKIREKKTGKYFMGGRAHITFGEHGMRYEDIRSVKAVLVYFSAVLRQSERIVDQYEGHTSVDYEKNMVRQLQPENFEVVKFQVVGVEIVNTDKK